MDQLQDISIAKELQALITTQQAWHYRVVPKDDGNILTFYADEQHLNKVIEEELAFLFSKPVVFEPLESATIQRLLNRHYRKSAGDQRRVHVKSSDAEGFVKQIIEDARNIGSSDIHIEIYDDVARVRTRIDGNLVERYRIGKADYPEIVNKVKINARLDITEKRLPQDGRITFGQGSQQFDIRVSVLPTLHGEKIVMRLLNNDATDIELTALGMREKELASYLDGIRRPNGIILISGPTGSGKTTTLYATLKLLNDEKRNVVTVEDPIEYTLDGINQVQLKESIGLTFASALRTFLRQDPDVIMLGEIRDGETAEMAIRAALTGHLVLSTIHTNSAWGTISRLIDMGVPPYLLSGTLNTSVAQRLVKKLCPHCKQEAPLDTKDYPPGFDPKETLTVQWQPVGCDDCHHTGYSGRTALYEVIAIDKRLGAAIRTVQHDIEEELKERGIRPLSDSAFELFKTGETSLEEAYPMLAGS